MGVETIFGGVDAVTSSLDALDTLGSFDEVVARRPLILCSSLRSAPWLEPALQGRDPIIYSRATRHVPRERVDEALTLAAQADAIIAIGGGAVIGLAKAIRLELNLPFIAIPTTYAGSEQTDLWGISQIDDRGRRAKQTGRDERVRPDLIIYDPALSGSLPLALSVQSLLNAMAHPISALSTGACPDERAAAQAIALTYDAARALVLDPSDPKARLLALQATASAGAVLDRAPLGEHHRRAHRLGGEHDLPHAPLHATLLVQTVATLDERVHALVAESMRESDPAARIAELLRRAGAPLSLRALGLPLEQVDPDDLTLRRAALGRIPSRRQRSVSRAGLELVLEGPEERSAARVILALPGRGGTAEGTIELVRAAIGSDPRVLIAAPMTAQGLWYHESYQAVTAETLRPLYLKLDAILDGFTRADIHLFGFSQGACLLAAWVGQTARSITSLSLIAGALPPVAVKELSALAETPTLFSIAEGDPWIERAHVLETLDLLKRADAKLHVHSEPGERHIFSPPARRIFREMVLGDLLPEPPRGFGNTLSSEALPSSLPRRQNNPRHCRYGLQPEQINNTSFVAPRDLNRRSWLYRARPSAQQRRFEAVDHPTLSADFSGPPDPNLIGCRPLPLPEAPTDFVEGLVTFGGAGSARLRRGFAVHLYAANRSMHQRAFSSADGEILLIPQLGTLHIQTEYGWLDIEPGWIAVIPRGVRFGVHLRSVARGWAVEVHGRSFTLPERGPVGANGLTEPRHFEAPRAHFEELLAPGFELFTRSMGQLYRATQDFTPFDVGSWHGDDVPLRYELKSFTPIGFTDVDHIDPSAFTVLTTPQDEAGVHTLDLVFFPPRTEATRQTFRPPFHHRNAVNELNLIVDQPEGGPFTSGMSFLTPCHTPHMVRASSVERAYEVSDAIADRPQRFAEDNTWLQLETSLPFTLTEHARRLEINHWRAQWGEVRRTFNPS